MKPEVVVQNQLLAYNARDLELFVSCYSEDVEIFDLGDTQPFITGSAALREVYREVFNDSPNLNATIEHRMLFDNKVIDYETVTGRKGVDSISVVVIYEVIGNLIQRVTFIRKN